MKAAQPGPGGKQGIKRLEARGGVIVIQKEQTATGETGIFEMKTNTVTLVGGAQGVVVTQGTNVLRGERLVVDLTTGYARVESGKGKTVQGIFSTNKDDKPGKDEKPGGRRVRPVQGCPEASRQEAGAVRRRAVRRPVPGADRPAARDRRQLAHCAQAVLLQPRFRQIMSRTRFRYLFRHLRGRPA